MAKVLIIDDDLSQLDLFGTAFRLKGFTVDTAESGEAGLDKLRQQRPDLVLLDIVMPGWDGLQTLKQIRADQTLANLPVLLMTNLSKPGLADEAHAAGANDFVLKTELNPAGLVERARKLMKNVE